MFVGFFCGSGNWLHQRRLLSDNDRLRHNETTLPKGETMNYAQSLQIHVISIELKVHFVWPKQFSTDLSSNKPFSNQEDVSKLKLKSLWISLIGIGLVGPSLHPGKFKSPTTIVFQHNSNRIDPISNQHSPHIPICHTIVITFTRLLFEYINVRLLISIKSESVPQNYSNLLFIPIFCISLLFSLSLLLSLVFWLKLNKLQYVTFFP